MKFKRFAATIALGIAAVAATAAPATAADWVVGANIGNVPWEFQDAQGKFVGFEIDLVNEVAKRAGKTVQIENIPFNGLFPAVQSGRIQIAISSITITPPVPRCVPFWDRNSSAIGTSSSVGGRIGIDNPPGITPFRRRPPRTPPA